MNPRPIRLVGVPIGVASPPIDAAKAIDRKSPVANLAAGRTPDVVADSSMAARIPVTMAIIIAAVTVGMAASLGWILLSADTFEKVYGLPGSLAPMPFSQPGLVTIPLGFLVLVVVSLLSPPPASFRR